MQQELFLMQRNLLLKGQLAGRMLHKTLLILHPKMLKLHLQALLSKACSLQMGS